MKMKSHTQNMYVLALCQCLYTAAISVDMTLTGVVGYKLAINKSLATLPFALIVVAGAITTFFAAQILQAIGRRNGFILGAFCAVIGGMISVFAIYSENFIGFCLGTAFVGVFQAFAFYYRFAAADAVSNDDKARAISYVMIGSVIAAVCGPIIAIESRKIFTGVDFAGSYLVVAILGALSIIAFMWFYNDDAHNSLINSEADIVPARHLSEIIKTRQYITAVTGSVVGYMVMMCLMTAAPIASVMAGHSINDGAHIMQWHLLGMYAPSLITGLLIKKYGDFKIVFLGIGLNLVCILFAISSLNLANFYIALMCLGVGWNFMFIASTAMLAKSYHGSEISKAQGFAELIRYIGTAIAALAAGPLLQHIGWSHMSLVMLLLLMVAIIIISRNILLNKSVLKVNNL